MDELKTIASWLTENRKGTGMFQIVMFSVLIYCLKVKLEVDEDSWNSEG